MDSIVECRPCIRVAHHYQFPIERNINEQDRIGYCYAFHLVDGGKGRVTVPGHSYSVKKGDLLFFSPKQPHSFYSDPEHLLSTYNIYCELWADRPLGIENHLVWNVTDFNERWMTEVRPYTEIDELNYCIPLQHHGTMMELFIHIVNHHQQQNRYSVPITNHLLKSFILELIQVSRDNTLTDYRIKAIMERIDKEANAGSDYDSWLTQSGLKKTQFHELFKFTAGLSPKAYWTKSIMKQASVALWESNRSITDIAADLGYSSIHHFTKQFTAYYGVSPSQFRKRKGLL